MSLVREALQKAEREAAARAARERGLPEHLHAAGQPYRAPRRGLPRPALVALACAPLVAAAGWMSWVVFRPATTVAGAPRVETVAPPEPALAPAREAAKTVEVEPATPPLEAPRSEPALAPTDAPGARTAAADVPAPAPPPARRPGVPPVPSDRFVREAVLDGGATRIELGGIAWSEAAPLAYLNGKLRGVGETVAGLEIRAIDRDQVVLATRDRTLVVTLR